MKRGYLLSIFLIASLVVLGCAKKKEEARIIEPEVLPAPTSSAEQIEPITIVPSEGMSVTSPAPVLSEEEQKLSHNKKIQEALKTAGYYQGEIDGKIGSKTKKAIREFQTAKGLKADGKVGPKTWAELEKVLSSQIQTPANKGY